MRETGNKKDDRMPEGRAGRKGVAASHEWRQQGDHSGGLFRLAIRATQVAPIDVGPQVFAANGAAGRFFDSRAFVGRNISPGDPVVNDLGDDTNGQRQFCLIA